MTRTKPGEAMTKTLHEREARLRQELAKVETQKKVAREKATGKTRARGYVRKWLEALTAIELKHETERREARYADFDSMEQAIDYVLAAMFGGVIYSIELPVSDMPEDVHAKENGRVETGTIPGLNDTTSYQE